MKNISFGQTLTINFPLSNASCLKHDTFFFVYGLSSSTELKTSFSVYRLNKDLKKEDSISIELGKKSPDSYLTIYADTLHGFLNFYLQEKGSKSVCILRTSKKFIPFEKVENVDIARLNNLSVFNPGQLYCGQNVFDIRRVKDSTGLQFYLNKYTLKSTQGNFDYLFQWQFPFDKKDIAEIKLIKADNKNVTAFVWRKTSEGTSQWLILVNIKSGQLYKAIRVSEKGDPSDYFYGTHLTEENTGNVFLIGQKRAPKSSAAAMLWVMKLDSNAEILSRKDFELKAPVIAGPANKKTETILFIFRTLNKKAQALFFLLDIYSSSGKCYTYRSTHENTLTEDADDWTIQNVNYQFNKDVDFLFTSPDKTDMNAKFCPEKDQTFESLHYFRVGDPACLAWGNDSSGQPKWVLTKNEIRKKQVNYFVLKPENKKYALVPLQKIGRDLNPGFLYLDDNRFIIFKQDSSAFQIQLYNW